MVVVDKNIFFMSDAGTTYVYTVSIVDPLPDYVNSFVYCGMVCVAFAVCGVLALRYFWLTGGLVV